MGDEGAGMPIRFKPDGSFEFDTIEEAIEWRDRLTKPAPPQPTATQAVASPGKSTIRLPPAEPLPQPQKPKQMRLPLDHRDFVAVFRSLSQNGRSILKALAHVSPNWVNTEELAELAGMGHTQVGPVFRSIYIQSQNRGYDRDEIIEQRDSIEPGQRHPKPRYRLSEYAAGELRKLLETDGKG